jgi:rubrerythrin
MSTSLSRSLCTRSRQNLTEAMKEEAFAFAKCKVLATQARKKGHGKLAGLLEETAEQHYLKQFVAQAELLGLHRMDQEAVRNAIAEESFVVDILCKLFAREASQDGDNHLARQLNEMRKDEMVCRTNLGKALHRLRGPARAGRKVGNGKRVPHQD